MRHVLFVDDDSSVLSGIKRLTYPMRAQWRVSFAGGGPAAIDIFEADPPDVVVSDMRMPGMDGAALLAIVRERWPGSVRIILSGYADEGAALRSIPVAHRFISKPCDPQTLLATVRSACGLQERIGRPELRHLVGGLGSLPAAPGLYTAITAALGRPDVSAQQLASIIQRDPGCTAKLLQLTNSAFFGLARSVTDLQNAVAYLGLASVRDVVLALESAALFNVATPASAQLANEVSAHSLAVAAAARELVPPPQAQAAFAAGLLHDIGRLVLAAVVPEQFRAVEEDLRNGVELRVAEDNRFGASHAEVGGYLLRLWDLPFTLVAPVVRHHDPDASDDPDPVVAAVAVAVTQTVTQTVDQKVDQTVTQSATLDG